MKITKDQINSIWTKCKKIKCDNKITFLFDELFKDPFWNDINIKTDNKESVNIRSFCKDKFKIITKKNDISNECDKIQAIINVFEMLKLKQESTKESKKFQEDQDALDKILLGEKRDETGLINEIQKSDFKSKTINNIINLQFYPAYRKLRLKEFLLQNHKRIAFEKDVFDSFSSKHISFMEGSFFWGIVENLHQGKKYWQYFMSNGAKEKLNLSEEQLKNLDVIHSAAKKSGSGIRLDHIIPRASLRTYFEMLCCEAKKTSDEKKIGLINTKVNWIYPYLVGCLVTKDENNWLKKQINSENVDEQELQGDVDLYKNITNNHFKKRVTIFKTYINHNKNPEDGQSPINILYYKKNKAWTELKLDETKDVQKIIENAKKSYVGSLKSNPIS